MQYMNCREKLKLHISVMENIYGKYCYEVYEWCVTFSTR
jgi:hypothetical protein